MSICTFLFILDTVNGENSVGKQEHRFQTEKERSPRFPDEDEILKVLEYGSIAKIVPIEEVKAVRPHKNEVDVVHFRLRSRHASLALRVELTFAGEKVSAVFKPFDGEDLQYFKNQLAIDSFYPRETAAYVLSRALDFNLVPPTVTRIIKTRTKDGKTRKRIGSLQLFVPETEAVEAYKVYTSKEGWSRDISKLLPKQSPDPLERDLQLTAVFDYLINNCDRHAENLLIKRDERGVYLIDNGSAFVELPPTDYTDQIFALPYPIAGPRGFIFEPVERRSNIYRYRRVPLPSYILESLSAFAQSSDRQRALREDLRRCGLSEREVEGVFRRLNNLLEHQIYL